MYFSFLSFSFLEFSSESSFLVSSFLESSFCKEIAFWRSLSFSMNYSLRRSILSLCLSAPIANSSYLISISTASFWDASPSIKSLFKITNGWINLLNVPSGSAFEIFVSFPSGDSVIYFMKLICSLILILVLSSSNSSSESFY